MNERKKKVSTKTASQLISELGEDHEKLKDTKLYKLFAAHIVNNPKMTLSEVLAMADAENSSSDEEEEEEEADDEEEEAVTADEDEEYEEDEEDDEDDEEDYGDDEAEEVVVKSSSAAAAKATGDHMCADCKCAANRDSSKQSSNGSSNQSSPQKSNSNKSSKSKKKSSIDMHDENTRRFVARLGREDSGGQSCDCFDCVKYAEERQTADDMAVKLVADEEKKKKKSERKKLQKKKKRDKKKAEKVSTSSAPGATASTSVHNNGSQTDRQQNAINDNNISDKSSVKTSNSNTNGDINSNRNNSKKSETNAKPAKNEPKTSAKNKKNAKNSADNKPNAKNSGQQHQNGGKFVDSKTSHVSSHKLSPKSEKDMDSLRESDVEEEELSFSSAYVSQIAQRKSKPSINQSKTASNATITAQLIPQSDTHYYDEYNSSAKNGNNYVDNSDHHHMNGFAKNSSNNNQQNNGNKNTVNNNRETDDEFPKYKQYFYEQKPKASKGTTAQPAKCKPQDVEKSIELAILANQRAESNKFSEAIDLFSQALSHNPNDYRFYVNRSYCYDSIQDFRSALKDADTAISLRPDWPKCHYRRGKALAGLKNYQESELSLKKVLTLEKDCDEALSELWHVRYGAIVGMGYDTTTANLYSSQYDSIKEALSALSIKGEEQKLISRRISADIWNQKSGFADKKDSFTDDDIYISDDEYNAVREASFEETSPTNPFGWKALWVGNVALTANLETVTALFRKFGALNYCNIFKGNNGGSFILVHYDNSESPRKAMTKYQGKVIPGVSIPDTPLTIRFRPNKDQKKPNYDQRLESDECYYWRTTGCARGDKCLYKHIQANKGVDKQAWMCNTTKKGLQPFQKTQK